MPVPPSKPALQAIKFEATHLRQTQFSHPAPASSSTTGKSFFTDPAEQRSSDRFSRSSKPAASTEKLLPIKRHTGLHQAVEDGQVAEVQRLLKSEQGRKLLNVQDEGGYTPLHIAAKKGNADLVEVLLGTHGINPDLETNAGHDAIDLARRNAEKTTKEVKAAQDALYSAGLNAEESGKKTESSHDIAHLLRLYDKRERDETCLRLLDNNRNTLHHATNRGRLEEMHKIIRENDADYLNAPDAQGNTPLHLATMNGDLNAVMLLMGKKGINPSIRNFLDYDAHDLAVMGGHYHLVPHLDKDQGITHIPFRLNTGAFFSLRDRTTKPEG